MRLEELEQQRHLLLRCIAGSKAYGLDTPTSDTDIKGVFVLPKNDYYGLHYVKQVQNESNDIVYYELKRFFELLLKNNPGILELLAIPEDCILYRHPIFEKIRPEMFLSRLCQSSFAGYALAQIKRAKGLNKKIMNPMDKERMNVLDFCYVLAGQGSVSLRKWLEEKRLKQEYCGLVNIMHMKDVYGIFYDTEGDRSGGENILGFRGVARKKEADNVSLSSIPKGMEPIGHMTFNREAYSKYCRDYKDYWDWVKRRNEARYKDTVAHGKNYDAKNMMHTFRLLDMAEEIAREGTLNVRRPNRRELLDIKGGKFLYDELVARAEERVSRIEELYKTSPLPDQPDENAVNRLLIETRAEYYQLTGTQIH